MFFPPPDTRPCITFGVPVRCRSLLITRCISASLQGLDSREGPHGATWRSPPELGGCNREVQVLRVANREGNDANHVAAIIEHAASGRPLRHWCADLDVVSMII